MKKHIFIYSLLLSSLIWSTGCKDAAIAPAPEPTEVAEQPQTPKSYYVSSELLASVPIQMLQAVAAQEGYSAYRAKIKYAVEVYKLVYTTTYQDKEIRASGLICVPLQVPTPAPILSAQHGTITKQSEAPTSFTGLSGFELFASAGYVTVIPDYIGFGEAKSYFHPYYDQKHSALAVVDMLKAGKQFCKAKELPLNGKLFLVGYSEGGYVTLAAQKEIETHPEHGLQVTAAAAGAGGYDLTSMLEGVKSGSTYDYPSYLAYVLQSYLYTNNWNRPLTDFFQEPYASRLPGLFDGTHGTGAINRELTKNPQALFAPAFFAALHNDSEELALKKALVENSLTNWVPQSPTRLFHGTADQSVPYSNSVVTYSKFINQGARNVELITIKGGTHSSSFEPMLQNIIPWIESF